jgi:hypothetical protein
VLLRLSERASEKDRGTATVAMTDGDVSALLLIDRDSVVATLSERASETDRVTDNVVVTDGDGSALPLVDWDNAWDAV